MEQGCSPRTQPLRIRDILVLAAAFGLLCGLVEGACLLILQKSRWAGGTINLYFVPPRILYVSPLADLILFVAVALLTAGIFRFARRPSPTLAVLFILIFMLVFDWLSLGLDLVIDPPVIAILSAGISARLAVILERRAAWISEAARRALPALGLAVIVLVAGLQAGELNREHSVAAASTSPAPDAPNVLILVMDTVRADRISFLGYPRATTPNLARLAAGGVLFENAISTSSWTLPAHASLLTGRFPFEHGAELTEYDGRYPTLAEAFQNRGYRTGAFSANTYYFTPQVGFGRGFAEFDAIFDSFGDVLARPLYGRQIVSLFEEMTHSDLPARRHAADINAEFVHWLAEAPRSPFFAVVNYFDAHAPYLPPGPFRSRFATRPNPGGILNYLADRESLSSPTDTRDESDAYDGAIAYVDAQIGALLAELRQRQVLQNTLLVVLSDHGEFFGEHGLYMHHNALYLDGIRVPVLVSWPGRVPSGVRVEDPVSIASLPATVMELVPGSDSIHFPGLSLSEFWNGAPPPERAPYILSELMLRNAPSSAGHTGKVESLLSAQWHYIQSPGEKPQLFDWREDPQELHNLAATAEGAPVAARIARCLNDDRGSIRRPACGLAEAPATSVSAGGAQ